jgi:hypothetical protein
LIPQRKHSSIPLAALLALVIGPIWTGPHAQVLPSAVPKPELKDLLETETFSKLKDGLSKIKDISDKGDQYYKDLGTLSPEDDQYKPDYDLPGSPELPSMCKDSTECADCFKEPYKGLQNTRFRFDKLRRLNRVTKTMLRDAISFGDAAANTAGGPAMLAWHTEKTKIRASETGFNQSYDAKYQELLATLKNDLLGIGACEAQFFNNANWYERFGFMYQNFMAEAYRRPD